MDKPTGGAAFPEVDNHRFESGMTLRDYFAAKAMQGICADPSIAPSLDEIVGIAYTVADAMLAERDK